MSHIDYFFDLPPPRYFREKGFFLDLHNLSFITWCFSRCSLEARSISYNGCNIFLMPYQFIFGRKVCVKETGLTEKQIRIQQNKWEELGLLKKVENENKNKYTIYEWSPILFNNQQKEEYSEIRGQPDFQFNHGKGQPDCINRGHLNNILNPVHIDSTAYFNKINEDNGASQNELKKCLRGQPKGQPKGHPDFEKRAIQNNDEFTSHDSTRTGFINYENQKRASQFSEKGPAKGPAKGPQSIRDNKELKEDHHHPIPSSSVVASKPDSDDDDFFFKNGKGEREREREEEILPGVRMSREDLEACIESKGSLESVKTTITEILSWPGRKNKITNWRKIIVSWNAPNTHLDKSQERYLKNEKIAEAVADKAKNMSPCSCRIETDTKKEQKGLLFYNVVGQSCEEDIFISFHEEDFKEKVRKALKIKNMYS